MSRTPLFISAAVASLIALLVGAIFFATNGLDARDRAASRYGSALSVERNDLMASPCLAGDKVGAPPSGCAWPPAAGAGPRLVIWGDSHGAQLATAAHDLAAARQLPWRQITKSRCPPILTPVLYPRDSLGLKCPAFNRAAFAEIAEEPAGSLVILAARWDAVIDGVVRFTSAGARPAIAASVSNAQADLRATVQGLIARGDEVVVLGQTPVPPRDVTLCLYRARFDHLDTAPCFDFTASETERAAAMDRLTWAFLTRATRGLDHVVLVRPWPDICDASACHLVGPNGPTYLDDNHLSKVAATRVWRRIDAALKAIPPTRRASTIALY